MARDAEQLAQHDPDHFHPVRHLDARECLDGEQVREVVHHSAEIVDAIGVRDVGMPRLTLAHLLGAAVVIADVGNRVDDLLAAQLQHDAQDAVRAGMLRAEVEKHEIVGAVARRQSPAPGLEAQRRLLLLDARFGHLKRAHLGGARRMVLAQRVARPGRGQQDPRAGAGVQRTRSRTCPTLRARTSSRPARGRSSSGATRRARRARL